MIPTRYPRIVGVTWFNLIKESDWRVQSSASSLQAFKAAINRIDAVQRPCESPSLSLQANRSHWADYSDYVNRVLTVDFTLGNEGPGDGYDLFIYNSWSTEAVAVETDLPLLAGDVPVGSSTLIRLRYSIPTGVDSFYTSVHSILKDDCGSRYRFPWIYKQA